MIPTPGRATASEMAATLERSRHFSVHKQAQSEKKDCPVCHPIPRLAPVSSMAFSSVLPTEQVQRLNAADRASYVEHATKWFGSVND